MEEAFLAATEGTPLAPAVAIPHNLFYRSQFMARYLPALRSRLSVSILAALAITLHGTTSFAIDDNLTKGATNNHVFESGVWGESIDLLNGGLNLTIPIGGTYRVSSDVSYQLKLSYSSKIWQI